MKSFISLIFLNYLRILSKLQLFKINTLLKLQNKKLTIIGITGSAGKTSVLYTLDAALNSQFKIKTNSGANSESGIPLNILGFKITNFSAFDWLKIALLAPTKLLTNWQLYELYIAEMGIDEPQEPKNMSYLLKIIKPQIGIFLNVNPVHSVYFDKTVPQNITGQARLNQILENIAKEKAKLINTLPQTGTAIINLEDPLVAKTTTFTPAKLLTIGNTTNSSLKILKTSTDKTGFSVTFSYQNRHHTLSLKNLALPEIYNITLGATLLATISLGIDINTAIKNIEANFSLPPGRSTLIKGVNNTTIIDSTYNSSPTATIEMLKLLSNLSSPRIAVLGDMRELGNQSKISHEQVYKQALKSADIIIGIGPETQHYFRTDRSRPIPTHTFQYWWQAADFLKNNLLNQSNYNKSTILVKGSQNTIFLEELIKDILADSSDSSKLCRQSKYWLKVKNNFKKSNS